MLELSARSLECSWTWASSFSMARELGLRPPESDR